MNLYQDLLQKIGSNVLLLDCLNDEMTEKLKIILTLTLLIAVPLIWVTVDSMVVIFKHLLNEN